MAKQSDQPVDPFAVWLSTLSKRAQRYLRAEPKPRRVQAEDEEEGDYDRWLAGLSPKARARLAASKLPLPPEEPEPDPKSVRWGCAECEDGEMPIVRLFKTAEGLARHLGKLEGNDVAVVQFHGHLLRVSQGPTRYLQMPDGETVLVIPRDGIGPVHRIDADLIDFQCQEDGFLGPPELADSSYVEQKLDAEAAKFNVAGGASDDDDDDDDEDEEGAFH